MQLVVFPSLDEGFGLPVAEGLAHGAAVIGADIPSIREILPQPDARFDPTDDAALSRAIADALAPARLDELRRRAPALAAPHTWERVADRTLAAWDSALAVRAARNRRSRSTLRAERAGLALVSPLAPDRSGVARYSQLLGDALTKRVPVTLVGSERRGERPGAGALEAVLTMRPHLEPVVALGDSDGHLAPLLAFLRTGGTALLHDTSMTHLAGLAASVRGDTDRDAGALLALVARRANRVLVHSDRARAAVLAVAADADVAVVPFGMARPAGAAQPRGPGPATVASFGHVQFPDLLVDTFARVHHAAPAARLVIAGPAWDDTTADVVVRNLELARIAHVVEGPRWWDEDEYAALLATTTVAVQLRSNDRGEQSAALGDALACGLAVVCNDRGPHHDVPDDAVLKLGADATGAQVADAVLALLADPGERARLSAGALRHAGAHSFAHAAEGLLAALAG